MTGRSHITFGLGLHFLAMASIGAGQAEAAYLIPVAVFAALLPDIDADYALIKNSALLNKLCKPFTLFGHRTVTHSLMGLIGVVFVLWLIPDFGYFTHYALYEGITVHALQIAFFVGYLSHIVADMLTPKGVALMWPSMRFYRLPFPKARGGSLFEHFLSMSPFVALGLMTM